MGQIATRDVPLTGTATIERVMRLAGPGMAAGLPRHVDAERFQRIALTVLRTAPRLLECSAASLAAALVQCAQLGLEPGFGGLVYLIPYKGEIQLQLGYRGMIELARRSGVLRAVQADLVHEGDEWRDWTDEEGQHWRHVPSRTPGRSVRPVTLVYAAARLEVGTQVAVMDVDEVESIKVRSQAWGAWLRYKKPGPWNTDWGEMAKKTAVRRLLKLIPWSPELLEGHAVDGAVMRGHRTPADGPAVIDYTPLGSGDVDEPTALPDMDALPGGPPPRRAPTPSGNTDPDGNPEPPEPGARG